MVKADSGNKLRGAKILAMARDLALISTCAAMAWLYQANNLLRMTNVTAVSHILIERSGADMNEELALLRSPVLQKSVIAELQLRQSPAFLEQPTSAVPVLQQLFDGLKALVKGVPTSNLHADVEQSWKDRVETGIEPHSHILKIVVSLPDARLASSIADTLANQFVQFAPSSPQPSRLDALRSRVDDLQRQTQTLRETSSLAGMQAQLPKKLEVVSKLIKAGQVFEAAEKLENEKLTVLLQERTRLKAEIAQESKTLLDQHPKMIALKEQLARIETEIRSGLQSAEANLRRDVQQVQDTESAPGVTLAALESQLTEAQRALNDALLKVANGEAETPRQAPERIVVPAEQPKQPELRQVAFKAAPYTLFGAVMGFGLVLMNRALHRRKAKLYLPRPISVDFEQSVDDFLAFAESNGLHKPAAPTVEVELAQLVAEQPSGAVLLNATALSSHRLLAEENISVQTPAICIIDMARRRSRNAGLAEVLAGDLALDAVVQSDPFTGIATLSSGAGHRSSSFGIDLVVACLQDCFDLVVIEGLDPLTDDLDELAPLISLAVLPDQPDQAELARHIESRLTGETKILHRDGTVMRMAA